MRLQLLLLVSRETHTTQAFYAVDTRSCSLLGSAMLRRLVPWTRSVISPRRRRTFNFILVVLSLGFIGLYYSLNGGRAPNFEGDKVSVSNFQRGILNADSETAVRGSPSGQGMILHPNGSSFLSLCIFHCYLFVQS